MSTVKNQLLKKKKKIQIIKENISESSAIIFYNFSSAENEEISLLKKQLKKVGAGWFIFKNTLFKKSLDELINVNDINISENNAFIFCKEDKYEPLKVLKHFDFQRDLEKNRIQGGIYDGIFVKVDELVK